MKRDIWKATRPQLPVVPGYCPYCNQFTHPKNMTEEHIIPKAIKRNGITILVCKQCNDFIGHKVDVLISRQTVLRIMAASSPSHATIQEQHRTQATLKDGTVLEGYLMTEAATSNKWKFAFAPLRQQPDGTRWIMAESVKKVATLPPDIHVLYKDSVKIINIPLIVPMEGIEVLGPALEKIFLGFAYSAWGYEALSSSAFDPIRDHIRGKENVKYAVVKMGTDGQVEHEDERMTPPMPLTFPNHLIWGNSVSGNLMGGVSLFAKVAMCIAIPEFGLNLEGRIAEYQNNCNDTTRFLYGSPTLPTSQDLLEFLESREAEKPEKNIHR